MTSVPLFSLHATTEDTPTILLIEDNAANLRVTRETLLGANYRCVCARSSEEGWKALLEGHIQLVISDLSLGAGALLARMRANPRFAHIPFIIASGERRNDVVQSVMEAGANAYLTKPYPPRLLLTNIKECLAQNHP